MHNPIGWEEAIGKIRPGRILEVWGDVYQTCGVVDTVSPSAEGRNRIVIRLKNVGQKKKFTSGPYKESGDREVIVDTEVSKVAETDGGGDLYFTLPRANHATVTG